MACFAVVRSVSYQKLPLLWCIWPKYGHWTFLNTTIWMETRTYFICDSVLFRAYNSILVKNIFVSLIIHMATYIFSADVDYSCNYVNCKNNWSGVIVSRCHTCWLNVKYGLSDNIVLSPNLRRGLKQNFVAKSGILAFLIYLVDFYMRQNIRPGNPLKKCPNNEKKMRFSKWPPCPFAKSNFCDISISRPARNIILEPKLMFSWSTNPIKYNSAT